MDLLKLEREGFALGDFHLAINSIKLLLNRHPATTQSNLLLNNKLDTATQSVLREYQKYKGLRVTGNADRETLYAVGTDMTDLEFEYAAHNDSIVWHLLTGVKKSEYLSRKNISMSPCEKALAKLFTRKESGIIFVDTFDEDNFDPITKSSRKGHDHIYNDPLVSNIQTATNFYIPAGAKVLAHFGWHGARKRVNTQRHKSNKHLDELWENQEVTTVFYEKLGSLRQVVFQIWHLDPFLNQTLPDGSILLGRMGKDGVMRYGNRMGDPDGFHIHINFYRKWWRGAASLYKESNPSILFPYVDSKFRIPLSSLCMNGRTNL